MTTAKALAAAVLLIASAWGAGTAAQTNAVPETTAPAPGAGPRCALQGSTNVFIQGGAMLRLGDVAGCPGVRYEVIPNVRIGGEPAVRILPQEGCAPGGAESVLIDGQPAQRVGDGC